MRHQASTSDLHVCRQAHASTHAYTAVHTRLCEHACTRTLHTHASERQTNAVPPLDRPLEPKFLTGPDAGNLGLFQESCLLSLPNRNVQASLDSLPPLSCPGLLRRSDFRHPSPNADLSA